MRMKMSHPSISSMVTLEGEGWRRNTYYELSTQSCDRMTRYVYYSNFESETSIVQRVSYISVTDPGLVYGVPCPRFPSLLIAMQNSHWLFRPDCCRPVKRERLLCLSHFFVRRKFSCDLVKW